MHLMHYPSDSEIKKTTMISYAEAESRLDAPPLQLPSVRSWFADENLEDDDEPEETDFRG